MAEYTSASVQSVAAGQNVLFTETAVSGNCSIVHREGAGIVTLRGLTNQCRARFKVSFGANISIPTDGTVDAISVALSVGGEALNSASAIVTPAAVDQYGNIYVSVNVDVPRGCCVIVAAENTSSQTINVANANMIVERVA